MNDTNPSSDAIKSSASLVFKDRSHDPPEIFHQFEPQRLEPDNESVSASPAVSNMMDSFPRLFPRLPWHEHAASLSATDSRVR